MMVQTSIIAKQLRHEAGVAIATAHQAITTARMATTTIDAVRTQDIYMDALYKAKQIYAQAILYTQLEKYEYKLWQQKMELKITQERLITLKKIEVLDQMCRLVDLPHGSE